MVASSAAPMVDRSVALSAAYWAGPKVAKKADEKVGMKAVMSVLLSVAPWAAVTVETWATLMADRSVAWKAAYWAGLKAARKAD